MIEIKLDDRPHIDLCDLLKLADLVESGGEGKHVVAEGLVKVDGAVELRKRAKIRSGQIVEYNGQSVNVL